MSIRLEISNRKPFVEVEVSMLPRELTREQARSLEAWQRRHEADCLAFRGSLRGVWRCPVCCFSWAPKEDQSAR